MKRSSQILSLDQPVRNPFTCNMKPFDEAIPLSLLLQIINQSICLWRHNSSNKSWKGNCIQSNATASSRQVKSVLTQLS